MKIVTFQGGSGFGELRVDSENIKIHENHSESCVVLVMPNDSHDSK